MDEWLAKGIKRRKLTRYYAIWGEECISSGAKAPISRDMKMSELKLRPPKELSANFLVLKSK
jgi:hypothetical protein